MARSVREVMTPDVRCVRSTTTIWQAARTMKLAGVTTLPLQEDGRVVGLLTDRDIVVRVVAEGRDPHATHADDVASRELVTISPEQDVDEALALMSQHHLRRLPVVEKDGRIVGILAQSDLAPVHGVH